MIKTICRDTNDFVQLLINDKLKVKKLIQCYGAHIKLKYIIVSESLYYLFQDQLLTAYPADV